MMGIVIVIMSHIILLQIIPEAGLLLLLQFAFSELCPAEPALHLPLGPDAAQRMEILEKLDQ